MAHLQCVVVTPESTILDEQVDFVALPLYDGEIGIAPGRSPMIGRLGYGELRLVTSGQTKRYYVDAGFVQVAGDVVSVLTNRAVPAGAIDPQVASEQLAQALSRKANSEELLAARDRLERQARGQLRVASRAR
jgi:F-type H+-transporting ATPase subunit epsilon